MVGMAVVEMHGEFPTEALVVAARGGDREAFSLLIERHRNLVFAYAFARLGEREEAEDVVQEAFVRAYLSLPRLRGEAGWQAWVMQITRNLCHDALRRKRVRRTQPLDPEWLAEGPTPEGELLSEEARRQLTEAVEALPEKFRVPLLMRFGSGCTRQEIALALGLPESTVVGRLAGAMRLLRRRMGKEWAL